MLLLCGDSTNVDRPGFSPSESVVGPHLEEVVRALRGADRRDQLRLEHPPRAAGRSTPPTRSTARSRWSGARCARTSASAARSTTSRCPRGCSWARARSTTSPTSAIVIISTGSQGEPLSALRRMAYRDHPQVELREGDTVVFSATPVPGNERAVNETIDRLYHIGCDVITPARRARARLRPRLRRGGQADAQPRQAALRDALPRRLQAPAPARPAGRSGRRRAARTSSRATTACRSTSTSAARASASASRRA